MPNYFHLGGRTYKRHSGAAQLALARLAQTGDEAARNDLIASYVPAVLRYVKDRCNGCQADHDDCTSFVFERLLRAVELFDTDRGIAVSTYFVTTILHSVWRFNTDLRIDYGRHRVADLDSFPMEDAEDPFDVAADNEHHAMNCTRLADCLRFVTDREKGVLWRHFAEGATLAVTGAELGVSKERARQIGKRAIQSILARVKV